MSFAVCLVSRVSRMESMEVDAAHCFAERDLKRTTLAATREAGAANELDRGAGYRPNIRLEFSIGGTYDINNAAFSSAGSNYQVWVRGRAGKWNGK